MAELILTYSWILFTFILVTTTILIINKSLSADRDISADKDYDKDLSTDFKNKLMYRGYSSSIDNQVINDSFDKDTLAGENINLSHTKDFIPMNIAVLTISDSRTSENDTSGKTLIDRIVKAGHTLAEYSITIDDVEAIRRKVSEWTKNKSINVIITSGGTGLTGRDVTFTAINNLLDKKIDGFSVIFHMISYGKIKTSTIQSRAFAGTINSKYIFCLPGSPNAVKDAWDEILLYQLDSRHRPCNLVEIIERLSE
tara:strand:- start:617 stop:1381 length:765 start_codon:yes stop_codon:yes gene_type:complete